MIHTMNDFNNGCVYQFFHSTFKCFKTKYINNTCVLDRISPAQKIYFHKSRGTPGMVMISNPSYFLDKYGNDQLCVWNFPRLTSHKYGFYLIDKDMHRLDGDHRHCACTDHLHVAHTSDKTNYVCGDRTYPRSSTQCSYGPSTCLHHSGILQTGELYFTHICM